MKLNKSAQYGILLGLYLVRAGRANLKDVSLNLNMSRSFLEQVASKLRRAGVLKSVRGPGGGYELIPNATVSNVLDALEIKPLLSKYQTLSLQSGHVEHRALANFVGSLSFHLEDLLNTKLSDVSEALVSDELEQLNSVTEENTVN